MERLTQLLVPNNQFEKWFRGMGSKYHALEANDEKEDQSRAKWSIRSSWITTCNVLVAIAVAVLAVLGFVGIWFSSISYTPDAPPSSLSGPCGNSSAEAIARGCKFDQLTWSWFPSYCPHYANDQYLATEPERPWQFFIDPYKKKVASDEDWAKALNNEVFLYGEKREHLTHCVFLLLGLSQILQDNGRHVQKYMSHEHMEHCAEMLLKASYGDETRYEPATFAGPVSFEQDC